jgi:MYND finger
MELCVCLSDFCKESNRRSFNEKCNQCGNGFENSQYKLGSTLMIGCKCVPLRLHTWAVCYHENCRFTPPSKEEGNLERYPILVERLSKDQHEEIRKIYFKNHSQKISMCAGCGLSATEKTKKCKGCHSVYYCNQECQNVNWQKHKAFCKLHRGVTVFKKCSCFNETEKLYYERHEKHQCCLDTCENNVDPTVPQKLSMMVSICSRKGVNAVHMFPKIFCSEACCNADFNKQKKI